MSIRLRITIFLAFFLLVSAYVHAGEIKGHVYDKNSKEQIVGGTIAIKSLKVGTVTELDGDYSLKNIAPGTYAISCTYLGYKEIDTTVTVAATGEVKMDFYLNSASKELKEVSIKSKAMAGSDADASRSEKNANNIVNIVSAHAILISPDILVSEVMQRVSGVSMERGNGGQGQYAIIRGMDKRYNTTLVNGVKLPSPDNRDRYIPLDIFPAELLERLEVEKSLIPSMEADATGGVINMIMRNAPDKLLIDANLGLGYSDIFQTRDFDKYSASTVHWQSPAERLGPNVVTPITSSFFPYQNLLTSKVSNPLNLNTSLTVGDRFFKNKLGVILSGSYQNTYNGYNADALPQVGTVKPSPSLSINNQPGFEDVYVRQYSTLSQRLGVESKIDYQLNNKNSISLFLTDLQLNEFRVRNTNDSLVGGDNINSYANMNSVHYRIETRTTLQSIYNATLQGNHQITNGLSLDWSLVTSEAKKQLPDDAEFGYDVRLDPHYDSVDNRPIVPHTGHYDVSAPYVTSEERDWLKNTDKDNAVYLNLHYITNSSILPLIDFGGLYRHKNRDNSAYFYSFNPILDATGYEDFVSIPASKFVFANSAYSVGNPQNAGTYAFAESLLAYYGQVHIEFGNLKILTGVRMENTYQSYVCDLPVSQPGKYASYTYTDFLPSLSGKYDFSDKGGLRFSYYESLYRPAYADLIPFPDQTANEWYTQYGNDTLKHSVAHNADIRYELYPKGLDEYMVGVFYKQIQDPIEYGLEPVAATAIGLVPTNSNTATNYGFELVFRKYFGSFGVSGNYTYTHSDINSVKYIYYREPNGNAPDTAVNQHRPLQGQAANIGNISLLYNNSKRKIEAQLALIYTGDRINTISEYRGLDVWEKPTTNLDFSINKSFGKHFMVYFKYKNILNTGMELYIKQANPIYYAPSRLPYQQSINYITLERDYYYSSLLVGVRYKLY